MHNEINVALVDVVVDDDDDVSILLCLYVLVILKSVQYPFEMFLAFILKSYFKTNFDLDISVFINRQFIYGTYVLWSSA